MWHHGCDHPRAGAGRGWDWETEFGPWFAGMRRRYRGGRGGRMFEHGDLKLVILGLLEEKPRHGYEIIKDLEERSGGRYAPSPGTVYPTLTLLEDMGYATASSEPGGKKVYSITDEGRQYVAENRPAVDDIFDRLSELGASIFGDTVRPAHEAMAALGRSYWRAMIRRPPTTEAVAKVAEILRKAAAEIDGVVPAR